MTTFPASPENDDTKVRQAMVRVLTNQMNQQERHHRHNMASQEALADSARKAAERSDQGHHSICSMIDEVSDQIAEGRKQMAEDQKQMAKDQKQMAEDQKQMATKADVLALQQQMNRIEEHLKTNDHVLIPRDQSNFDAEDDFFD